MPENEAQRTVVASPGGIVQLAAGILSGIQGVVGEGASHALLRYGAFEQGRRLALEATPGGLPEALAHLDRLLGQNTIGVRSTTGPVRIEATQSPTLAAEQPLLDTIVLGLYEGLLNGVYQSRFRGQIVERGRRGTATLEFQPERP